jgi:hypothetical protein
VKGATFQAGVPADLQSAFELAVTRSRFALHRAGLNLTVAFTSTEPPANDLFDFTVKRTLEDVQSFITLRRAQSSDEFDENALHTIGHVFFAVHMAAEENYQAQQEISSWFVRSGYDRGNASDWIAEDWMLSTREAIAEFFKDVYLKPRISNNRTAWEMENTLTSFGAFVTLVDSVLCPGVPT